MLAKSENCELVDNKKISVVVLCCDEASDISVTFESLERFIDDVAECIIADAAGAMCYEALESQTCGLKQISVRCLNLAENLYQNMAQLKNDVVRYANCDRILMAAAGEKICLDKVVRVEDTSVFEKIIVSGRRIVKHIVVSRSALGIAGGWNGSIDCGEDYELALRICDYSLGLEVVFNDENADIPVYQEDYYTDAYIVSKYAAKLQKQGLFDLVFQKKYNESIDYGIKDYFVSNMETFMSKGTEYEKIDEVTRPVLVFSEKGSCNGALHHFAKEFANALRECGQNVYIYTVEADEQSRNIDEIMKAITMHSYRAAVEFQAGIFTAQLASGELVGNVLKCPKFMYEFDHPLYISWHFMLPIKDYYVLSQDEIYAEYVREHFPNVKCAWHMPLAGEQMKALPKEYDLTFVAAYNNYRNCLSAIREMQAEDRKIALAMLRILKNNPDLTAEAALTAALEKLSISVCDKRAFTVMLHRMREVVHTVTFYYREKVVHTLVLSGIKIHVFSDTWKKCPFADNSYLVIHSDVPYEEGIRIIAQSRVTLNVMSWHKGGMTERVANAMLNKAVCVTDKTSYIERHFADGRDIVMFALSNIELLPARIKELLSMEGRLRCSDIAEAAYKKALASHTWSEVAKAFMEILSKLIMVSKGYF